MNQKFLPQLALATGTKNGKIVYVESGIRPTVNFFFRRDEFRRVCFMSASRANPFSDVYSLVILYLNPIFPA